MSRIGKKLIEIPQGVKVEITDKEIKVSGPKGELKQAIHPEIKIETGPKGYPESSKKAIRRSGLEIKKAQEQEELKKAKQEKEWEIPAFLRRVKFKS